MRYVGISLQNTEGEVPTELRERLKAFWAWRVSQAAVSKDLADRRELAEFGWWYASGKLEDAWALEQLITAVEIAGRAEPEHQVLQRLATMAREMPGQAIRLLRLMIDSAQEHWRVLGWTDEVRAILTAVLGSGDERAAGLAVDLIHEIGAKGVRDFSDLVRTRRS